MTGDNAADPYYQAIEEQFVRRRGAAMILSPRDWNLIGEWKDEGIPLRIVLQAIDNIFDAFTRRAPAGRRINSLSYCRQEVLALHDLYRALHAADAGRPGTTDTGQGRTAAALHLGRLARRVRAAMALASQAGRDPLVASLARVAAELKQLRREIKNGVLDPSGLEDRLRQFDDELLSAARHSIPEEDRASLERAADRALGTHGDRMTPAAREKTRRALLASLVREAASLPRLTLFD
jgi:hypothetical protein